MHYVFTGISNLFSSRLNSDSLAMVWEMGPTPMNRSRTENSNPLELAKSMASQIVSVFSGNDYDDASSGFEDGDVTDYMSGEDSSSYDSRSMKSFKSFSRRLRRLRERRREGGAASPELISPPSMNHTAKNLSRAGSDASSLLLTRTFSGAMEEEKKDDDQGRPSSMKPDPVHGPSCDGPTKKVLASK